MADLSGIHGPRPGNGIALGHFKANLSEPASQTESISGDGEETVDAVDLSGEAETFVAETAGEEESSRPGKSGNSMAHRAFALLQENASLSGMPFGKIVSTLARTGSLESLLPKEEPVSIVESEIPANESEPATDVVTVPVVEEPGSDDDIPVQTDEELALAMLTEMTEVDGQEEEVDLLLDIPETEEI